RKIPWDDLSYYADRLAQRVAEILCAGRVRNRKWNGVALELGSPSRHVAKQINRQGNVCGARDSQRLTIIERFEIGELFGMRFDQVGEFPDQASAFGCRHL